MSANFNETLVLLKQFSRKDLIAMFNLAMEGTEENKAKVTKCDCPYCSGKNVIRFGLKRGKQRFFCKDCSRTFVETTNTVMSMSHYGRDIWEAMFLDTIAGNALLFTAVLILNSNTPAMSGVKYCTKGLPPVPEILVLFYS